MHEAQIDTDYRELIKKAYIDPIKSVMAIDDQYQSLDKVLSSIKDSSVLSATSELSRQIKTLRMVRENNWLADMHDGETSDNSTISDRLHQCDLLLLDYHLDINNDDNPEQALHIVSKLNQNHHFNLVIVYTAADDLKKVRSEIFVKLSSGSIEVFDEFIPNGGSEAIKLLKAWEEEGESYCEDMLSTITRKDLETAFSQPSIISLEDEFIAIFNPIEQILTKAKKMLSDEAKKQLYLRLLKLKIAEFKIKGDFSGTSNVKASSSDSDFKWLKTEKLFIAIVSKTKVNPDGLLCALTGALQDWHPTNNRLLLSKIKSELDDNGQTFENEILRCKYTNAGWLKQFYEESNGMDITVSRLMEGLTTVLCNSDGLKSFSELIKSSVESQGLDNAIKLESPSLGDLAEGGNKLSLYKALNSYVGTKRVNGKWLMTGHVIEWKASDSATELLLCLTPACDLQPDRIKDKGWKTELAPYLPVKIIRLMPQDNENKALKEITKEPVLALTINGNTAVYRAAKRGGGVFHEQLFVADQGRFADHKDKMEVEIHRTVLIENKLSTVDQKCEVVTQLRYEYALNFLQRLGQDLTKIGLDYVAYKQ